MKNTQLIHHFNALNMKMFRVIQAHYKALGLEVTPVHARIMLYMNHHQQQLCQKDIESMLLCNKSTLSAILHTMEKNGLITRCESSTDLRYKTITLTKKALAIVTILEQDNTLLRQTLMENLQQEDIACFEKVLTILERNLDNLEKLERKEEGK